EESLSYPPNRGAKLRSVLCLSQGGDFMLRFLLSLVAFFISASLYAEILPTAYDQALKSNVPLLIGVGHDPVAPKGWVSCRVASFDKAIDGDQVVLIPSGGSMWRVKVEGDLETSVTAIRQSWEF